MSNQSLAVQAFCFEGMKDVQSIADELARSDPEAARELRKIDWVLIRKHVAKESMQQLAEEQKKLFLEGTQARDHVREGNLFPVDADAEVVGIIYEPRGRIVAQDFIFIGMVFSARGTCECFGNFWSAEQDQRSEDVDPRIRSSKPGLQKRLEEIYRERMTKAVFQVLLGTEADEIKKTADGTIVMRFPIKEEV